MAGSPSSERAPSNGLPVPPELEDFLRVHGPRILFVRGPEGTGKAAIAARILELWGGVAAWVSTRGVDPLDPNAGRGEPTGDIVPVDLSWAGTLARGAHEELVAARDALGAYYRGTGTVPPSDDWLPASLAAALEGLPKGIPPTLAVDSWEGLVNRYLDLPGGPPGEVLRTGRAERLLLGLFVARGSRLVAVSEHGDSDLLESVADAVIVTATAELEDRLIRIFSITKLRGFPVEETVYPYSLDGGRFQYLPRLSTNPSFTALGSEPDPNPEDPDSLWPGSASFAHAFGRLDAGGVSVLEVDPSVPGEAVRLLTGGITIPALARGSRALIVLTPDISPERIYAALRHLMSDERILQQVRLVSSTMPADLDSIARRLVVPLQPPADESGFIAVPEAKTDRYVEPLFPESTRFLSTRQNPNAPNLAIVHVDGLQAAARTVGLQYTPDAFAAIVHQDAGKDAAHVVVIARSGDPLLEAVRPNALPYVRLMQRQGRLFLFGIRPWTPAYALQPAAHPEAGRPYSLIRLS